MDEKSHELIKQLPQVGIMLESESGAALQNEFGAGMARLEIRAAINGFRECIRNGRCATPPSPADVTALARKNLKRLANPSGRRAINAAGILLHTGLGRAPMCKEAVEALNLAGGYSVLQASLETGKRCLREENVERMLVELTGCEAATVVNNNAAATMLILNTLAANREVVISRGQLIEIGGAYRMMDVMTMSGCILREVGCTNRTHLRDYESAINEETGALIHVHTSNYRVRGFSGTPGIAQLAPLGKKCGLPVIDDLGSGALVPLSEWGLPNEPLVTDSIKAGADVCCFSGDKLICGPQAGIIVGKKDVIARIRKNPFSRMFRICKLTLGALEMTLQHFVNGTFRESLPFYRKISRKLDELDEQAKRVAGELAGLEGLDVRVMNEQAYVGSGSIPDETVPSVVVALEPASKNAEELARKLRFARPSVFGRISDGALLLDMRTVDAQEVDDMIGAIKSVLQ